MGRLQCPRCATVVDVAPGASPVCPRCGFGSTPQPVMAPPGYAHPSPGYPVQPPGRTDSMAIASLVMGCMGWLSFLGVITDILAIVFGIMALNHMKRDPTLRGKGMAIAGIVLGCAFLALLAVFLIIGLAFLSRLGRY